MRKWLVFFMILGVVVILAIAASIAFYWMIDRPVRVARHSVLELSIGGSLTETPSQNPFVQLLDPNRPSLVDYWQMLEYAAEDDRILAVLLEVQPMAASWAQVEELRDSIAKFRASGKPIHAFLAVDLVGEAELYLAAAADTITLNPDTSLLVNGLVAEITFYKRTLEKIGVKPQFIQFKEFKSPGVYERENMTPAIRGMLESVLGDLEGRFVEAVAKDRGIDPEVVRDFLELGINTPQRALEVGLIDRVGYRPDLLDEMDNLSSSEIEKIAAKDYLEGTRNQYRQRSQNKVALITGAGVITAGRSDSFASVLGGSTLASHLRQVREEENFDAVLLRVDSPGGSAVGSDMVWREVRLLEEAGKPVVVSMSGVAGSGGYYIAMGASRIVSQPSTITGSIGVLFGKFDIEGLYDWLGMDVDRVKISPSADLFSPFTSLTPDQEEQITAWMQEIYQGFVEKAAEGRGSNYGEFEPKARGRIYTGSQALELGLVDALGGFEVAVDEIRGLLDLGPDEAIELVQYPRPKGLWDALTSYGLVEARLEAHSLQSWMESELQTMSSPAPRLLMPNLKIR